MRSIRNENEAVVGIVVTVLLIGLVLAVIVMINTVYVPQWVEKQEVAHMDQVSQQFSQLKYAIDMQAIINGSTGMSTGITLGSGEIPFFNEGRSFGSLFIDSGNCIITIRNSSGNETFESGSIRYSSSNLYHVNQEYIYQAGALILKQNERTVLLGRPSLIVNDTNNIAFTFVNISGVNRKSAVGGFGTYEIFTQVSNPNMSFKKYSNITNITINTSYTDAWNTSIQRSFLNLNYIINDNEPGKLTIEFDEDEDYDLFVREVKIRTEIGFG